MTPRGTNPKEIPAIPETKWREVKAGPLGAPD